MHFNCLKTYSKPQLEKLEQIGYETFKIFKSDYKQA